VSGHEPRSNALEAGALALDPRRSPSWGAERRLAFFFDLFRSDLQLYVKRKQHKTKKKMTINLGPNEI
jgi:hypothetical protein